MKGFLEESLSNRLDTILYETLQQPQVKTQHQKALRFMEQLKVSLDEPQRTQFVKWDEDVNQVHAWEKECVYRQGVRDGAQLIFALLHCDMKEKIEAR